MKIADKVKDIYGNNKVTIWVVLSTIIAGLAIIVDKMLKPEE